MITKKTLLYWTICSIVLIPGIHLLDGWPAIDDWFGFGIGAFFAVLLLIIFSIILSVIIAAYPFNSRKTPGKAAISRFIPTSSFIITGAAIVAFLLSRPSYAKAVVAPATACQTVHEGKFKLNEIVYERSGNQQIETNSKTGEQRMATVQWLNDCEYRVTDNDNPSNSVEVKILSVTDHSFTCIVKNNDNDIELELEKVVQK
jgi:hypothetical protein